MAKHLFVLNGQSYGAERVRVFLFGDAACAKAGQKLRVF